jgi:hypothetical protein
VTAYTIAITPDDDHATAIRLRLDISGDQVVLLTDLHLHASDGLSTGQLPTIDYGLLLQAIAPTTPTPLSLPPGPPVPAAEIHAPDAAATPIEPAAPGPARARTAVAKPATAAEPATAAKPATKVSRGGRRSAGAPAPAAQPVADGRLRRANAANEPAPVADNSARTAKKAARETTATTSSQATNDDGRAYRRMPEDFAAIYQQAGSAAAVAEHYQVPRHTANGWIRRLRDQRSSVPTVDVADGHDVPVPPTSRVHTPTHTSYPRLPQFRSYTA